METALDGLLRGLTDSIGYIMAFMSGVASSLVIESARRNREKRASLGKALTCLLRMRHWLIYLLDYQESYINATMVGISEQEKLMLKIAIDDQTICELDFEKMLEEAVNIVSSYNPILGADLADKDKIIKIIVSTRRDAVLNATEAEIHNMEEQQYINMIIGRIEKLLRFVSWHFSLITWVKIRLFLRQKNRLSRDQQMFILLAMRGAMSRQTKSETNI